MGVVESNGSRVYDCHPRADCLRLGSAPDPTLIYEHRLPLPLPLEVTHSSCILLSMEECAYSDRNLSVVFCIIYFYLY